MQETSPTGPGGNDCYDEIPRIEPHPNIPEGGDNTTERLQNSVDHPKHYASDPSGVECIEITEHRNFCVGNAIKYLWRAGRKGDENSTKHVEDLMKAIWYCNREIQRIENERHSR